MGYDWATEPLSRITMHNLSFQQLYVELEAAHQLSKEARLAILRDNIKSGKDQSDIDEAKVAGILYGGQGKYAFRNKERDSRTNTRKTKKAVESLSITECFNCGNPSHMLKESPKDVSLMRAAKSRME